MANRKVGPLATGGREISVGMSVLRVKGPRRSKQENQEARDKWQHYGYREDTDSRGGDPVLEPEKGV